MVPRGARVVRGGRALEGHVGDAARGAARAESLPASSHWWCRWLLVANRPASDPRASAVRSAVRGRRTRVRRCVASPAQLKVGQKLAVSAYSLAFYLWKTLVPTGLAPLYRCRSAWTCGRRVMCSAVRWLSRLPSPCGWCVGRCRASPQPGSRFCSSCCRCWGSYRTVRRSLPIGTRITLHRFSACSRAPHGHAGTTHRHGCG